MPVGVVKHIARHFAIGYLLQAKNGESCKTKIHKVAIGKSIKLQTLLHA
jgi:hypothetical protein